MSKECDKCRKIKKITDFYNSLFTQDKKDNTCKFCRKKYLEQYKTKKICKGVDKEIYNLILLLNEIDGIQTISSCFGHYRNPVRIWFEIKNIKVLNNFVFYSINSWCRWKLIIDNMDIKRNYEKICVVLKSERFDKNILEDIKELEKQLKTVRGR